MDYQPNPDEVVVRYRNYMIRPWKPEDREEAAAIAMTCLAEYGVLVQRDDPSFRDIIEVEAHYWKNRAGELWICEDIQTGKIVGTGGYCEIETGSNIVEIKKLYLSRHARGQGLGKKILETLERRIKERGYCEIHIQTATFLKEACKLYEANGFREAESQNPSIKQCDLLLTKSMR
jgi:putative acetyltransferase